MTNEEYLSAVNDLSVLNRSLKAHPFDEAIDELEDKIRTNQYRIAMVGEFSSGKSMFINALIGEELLYSATIEATGVITTVQYGDEAIAEICKKHNNDIADDVIEEIDLSSDEGRNKLNAYLDIRNALNADQVNIYYPIYGMGRDIVFFDTPGIEKLSKQQMLMTKRIISEVNAVIFLITKKGFTDPSLKVIAGEHEIIGKIPSKDIMVVMTHIGEVYDEKKHSDPELQIEKNIAKAKADLGRKNLGDIDVIPLDSRDYLWGTNNRVYLKEQETRDEKLKGPLLEQSIYRERSKFDEFKDKLYKFLDKDNLKRSRERDIENTLLFVSEAIEQEIKKQHETGSGEQILLKNRLEKQIETACEGQRKFYNRLARQLQIHMENFLESVEKDAESEKRQKKVILTLIDQLFECLSDINKERVEKCVEATIQDVETFARKIEMETNKHLQITNDNFITKCFSEQFQKIFDQDIEVRIGGVTCDFSLILEKNDYDVSGVINDSDLEGLKEERKEEKRVLSELERSLESSSQSVSQSKKECQREKELLEIWYNNELARLGARPKAKQKYREETRSKGVLFWKKTWTEKIPDGLDYSAGQEWDRKRKDLLEQYEIKFDQIESKYKTDKNDADIRRYSNLIDEHKSKINHLNVKIKKCQDYIEDDKRRYTAAYISEKKEEVASLCGDVRVRLITQVCEDVRIYINKRKKEMESRIRDEARQQVARYQEKLEKENRALSEKIQVTAEVQDTALSNINKIKEKITYGKSV